MKSKWRTHLTKKGKPRKMIVCGICGALKYRGEPHRHDKPLRTESLDSDEKIYGHWPDNYDVPDMTGRSL